MCDYCGCHETEPVRSLAAQHEQIRHLVSRTRSAIRAGEPIDALLASLCAALRVHGAAETVLYAELAVCGEVALAGDLRAEHHTAEAALLDSGAPALALLGGLDEVSGHIFREEHDLFPALHLLLDGGAFDRIIAAVQAVSMSSPHGGG